MPFLLRAFPILEPSRRFVDGWHLHNVAEHLELLYAGEIQYLIINEPPRCMKSMQATIISPCWAWLKQPHLRFMFSSYSGDLAIAHQMKRRRLLESDWYRANWSMNISFQEDENRKTNFENTAMGAMRVTSTGGTVGGHGGDVIIADDPQDPQKGDNEADRLAANEHVEYLYTTRMNDPHKSGFILIMQRLHKQDATAVVLEHLKTVKRPYAHVVFQAEADRPHTVVFPRSKQKYAIPEGALLWEPRLGRKEVTGIREGLGSFRFAAQYQQRPFPAGGGLVKQEWWKFYTVIPKPFIRLGWYWDMANKVKTINDWSCGVLIGETEDGYYFLDHCRKRLLFPELKNEVILCDNANPGHYIKVEDKAAGTQVIQVLQREIKKPVLPVQVNADKVQRVSIVSPLFEAGKVWVPLNKPWVRDMIDEWTAFPNGAFDDQVDAGCMGLTDLAINNVAGSFAQDGDSCEDVPASGTLGERPVDW